MVPEFLAHMALPELAAPAKQMRPGYNFSLNDIARFDAAYNHGNAAARTDTAARAGLAQRLDITPPGSLMDSAGLRVLFEPLERMNVDAKNLASEAAKHVAGGTMTPSDMVMLTVRSHEFLFHCELTSNIANRSSDGVQQLFRQQS